MREAGIRSQNYNKRHRGFKSGDLSHVAPNTLNRQFEVGNPNHVWVTEFTDIRTHDGWLYLTIVLDLFSRQVVGWSMKADLVVDALLMVIWRRKSKKKVLIHSDQDVQYTCSDWRQFVSDNNLELSMSRRGSCHDNAVAENFFSRLKTERVKRKI